MRSNVHSYRDSNIEFCADRRLIKTESMEFNQQQVVMAILNGQCLVGAAGQFSLGANRLGFNMPFWRHVFMQHANNRDAVGLLNVVEDVTGVGEASQPVKKAIAAGTNVGMVGQLPGQRLQTINIFFCLCLAPLCKCVINDAFEVTLGLCGKFIMRHRQDASSDGQSRYCH